MPKLSDFVDQEVLEQIRESLPEDKFEKDPSEVDFLPDDGSFIPRERLNTKNEKIKALEEQRDNLEDQLEQIKEDTEATEELKDKVENLQEKNEQLKEQKNEEVQQTTKRLRTKLALKEAGAKNPDVVTPLLNMDEIELKENGDRVEVSGLEDQLEDVKEENDYLFESEPEEGDEPPGQSGGEFEGGTQPPTENPFEQENVDLERQAQLLQENPSRAKSLIKEAGGDPSNYPSLQQS